MDNPVAKARTLKIAAMNRRRGRRLSFGGHAHRHWRRYPALDSQLCLQRPTSSLYSGGSSVSPGRPPSGNLIRRVTPREPLVQFVSFVLDDTQKTWTELLPQQEGKPYRHAKLVLFRDSIQSGCGGAEAATGPVFIVRATRGFN